MKILSSFHILASGVCMLLIVAACKREAPKVTAEHTAQVQAQESKPVRIVEPEVVQTLLNGHKSLKIIEISKSEAFAEAHLPGALNIWRPDYENRQDYPYEGMRATKTQMKALLSRLGIAPQDTILVYCRGGNVDALRLFWILDLYGHEHLLVMNGGFEAWRQAGFPVSKEKSSPIVTDYRFEQPENDAKLADLEEVLTAIGDTNIILLDTREAEEFNGFPYIDKGKVWPWKDGASTFGRIPGAVHINWSEAVELNGDHRFKSLRALRWNFETRGITPDKTIITYCQSGVRSAHTTFVLTDILGYPHVKNYDGSWIEWSYHYHTLHDVPVERELTEAEHAQRLADLQKKGSKKRIQ